MRLKIVRAQPPNFTPDITPAQIVTIGGAILGVVAAAGIPLSKDLQDHILTLITVTAPLLLLADAHIRHGRARGAGAAGFNPKTGTKVDTLAPAAPPAP
jgi:hypothetical protein